VPKSVVAQRQSEAACKLELVINNLQEETPNNANKSKWSMWVALRGLANEHTAAIIEKVVYEVDPACKENGVTTYPPFFSLCRHDAAPSMVRCRVYWVPRLGIRPTHVDHSLVLAKNGNCTIYAVDVDRDALDGLELEVLRRLPSSLAQPQLGPEGDAKLPGVDQMALNALGLEVPQRRALEQAVSWVPQKTCTTKDKGLLEVVVGNHHRAMDCWDDRVPCHEWTMYVMLPGLQVSKSAMIDKVIYKLHPKFCPDTHTLKSPNFDLTCVSCVPFEVTCTIQWNPMLGLQPTTLVHELVLEELGGRTSATVSVSPRRMHFFS